MWESYLIFSPLSFFFRWRYSPLWALACQTIPLHFPLSITNSLHLLTPSTLRSLSISYLHPFLGLPLRLFPSSSWVKIFFGHPILLRSLQVTQPTYPFPLYPFYYSLESPCKLNLCSSMYFSVTGRLAPLFHQVGWLASWCVAHLYILGAYCLPEGLDLCFRLRWNGRWRFRLGGGGPYEIYFME